MIIPTPVGAVPANPVPEPANWPAWQKIGFRFFFVFFILYIILVPSDVLPAYGKIFYPFMNWFQGFIGWAAKILLHISVAPVTRELGDSGGDSTFDYLLYLFVLLISAAVAAIWSYTGRKTRNYSLLFYWLLVGLRYFVAFTMLLFGAAKVFRVQFPAPGIDRLMERVGDMSPMGLAWTYMGYSPWFNYFTGGAELLCAGLLLFRRTSRLGVVIAVVLMLNIVAINFCFDVCVKISSTTLLMMCFFILIPDYGRFTRLFFDDRASSSFNLARPAVAEPGRSTALLLIKYALIGYALYWNFGLMKEQITTYGYGGLTVKKTPLAGLYDAPVFVHGRDTLRPLTTDTVRWRRFWIGRPGLATVQLMNDSTIRYSLQIDTVSRRLTLKNDGGQATELAYTPQPGGAVLLAGCWKSDSVVVQLHPVDLNRFRLISRGFHMINELPYNK